MTVNWDINLGNIVPIGFGFIGLLWRLHTWDVKTNVRHIENTTKFDALTLSHIEIKSDIQRVAVTQQECQNKINETREMVTRLDERSKSR